jgi:hypothetical protein
MFVVMMSVYPTRMYSKTANLAKSDWPRIFATSKHSSLLNTSVNSTQKCLNCFKILEFQLSGDEEQ